MRIRSARASPARIAAPGTPASRSRPSHAEVAFHKSVELAEIGWPDESITYDDYQADFAGPFHDLREAAGFSACLSPTSYVVSQSLASRLLEAGVARRRLPERAARRAAPAWPASGRRWSDASAAPARGDSRGRAATGPRIEAEATAARTRSAAAGRSRRRREHDRAAIEGIRSGVRCRPSASKLPGSSHAS